MPAAEADLRYPIMARLVPPNLEMLEQSSVQGIITTRVVEDDSGNLSEELIVDPADSAADRRLRRRRIHLESPIPEGDPDQPRTLGLVSPHVSISCPC